MLAATNEPWMTAHVMAVTVAESVSTTVTDDWWAAAAASQVSGGPAAREKLTKADAGDGCGTDMATRTKPRCSESASAETMACSESASAETMAGGDGRVEADLFVVIVSEFG